WKARLTDVKKNEWGMTPLKNHYHFAPVEDAFTILIPKGKSVSVTHVDELESPRLIQLKPPPNAKIAKPAELRYCISSYDTAYTKDLKKRESIYWIGRGKTAVEWKEVPIPPDTKTRAEEKHE